MAAGVVAAVLGGRLTDDGPVEGRPSAVDVGFAQDMISHHQQAVTMSDTLAHQDNPRLRLLAEQIRSNQLMEIGQLQGLLMAWGEPLMGAAAPMEWMHEGPGRTGSHGSHPSHETTSPDETVMPGMATQAKLNELNELTGSAQATLFLRLMIRHHQGGVIMATDAAKRASTPAVKEMAQRMAFVQVEEIDRMRRMLGDESTPSAR
ncbi:DUF305 domain-containing protein [Nocardioides immobilis]|uniref:DUF305 domain-containing protein n=1 Tax=Nocardioides immobilis TaxID=2049295 RepID=UPI0015FBD7C0|nr:DUF305 domain-containing protein [Nocardioides immobilis]